ncbi:MAG: hypothetical protein NZ480_01375, partial [Bdellovibrionaceae bacterium]|nr:hypothetical protein [Pseudobdellovibrionaceae bacterium]
MGLWFVWLSPKSYELAVWFQVEKGKAILRRANYQEELMAHGQHDIHEGDSLLLDDISTGILVIPAHQARIRLLESTELNLARAPGGRWLIRLTKGDLEVLEGDQLDRIFIEDAHGNIVNLSKWGWDRTKNETPESTPSTKSKTLAYYEGEELHNIDESYQKLRPQLLKCYSKWHQDSD